MNNMSSYCLFKASLGRFFFYFYETKQKGEQT